MFYHNINPDLLKIGFFSIRFYGIVYALGFLSIGYYLSKSKIKNLPKEKAWDLVSYTLLFSLIGARLFHVISDFHLYKNNLLGIFEIWKGGLGWYGGLFFGIAFIIFYTKKHKIETLEIFDKISLILPLFIGLGRIANFINSEHLGFPANPETITWCVVFQNIDTFCRHPTQLYEAISMFLVFGVLILINKFIPKLKTKGILFSFYLILYSIARFTTDFFRESQSIYILGLAHTQIISLITLFIGIYLLFKFSDINYSKLFKIKKL
ncbi:MAG: prolipoprotein diacylglyceryl transferase [Candidatus Woesearchaeota archaeon]